MGKQEQTGLHTVQGGVYDLKEVGILIMAVVNPEKILRSFISHINIINDKSLNLYTNVHVLRVFTHDIISDMLLKHVFIVSKTWT